MNVGAAPLGAGLADRGPRQKAVFDTWCAVVLFALAMAWVESAVVFYLRTLINRIVPYQPHPLPISGARLGGAEVIREAATLVMLAAVGWLAGQSRRSRIGYGLLAFGVWDIAYYLWLIPLTAWPTSLADWDILFLIPLPWWGPVWAPVSIALLMCGFGTQVILGDRHDAPLWPGRPAQMAALLGMVLALYVFMADALNLVWTQPGARENGLRHLLPTWFNWPLFTLALALLAAPLIDLMQVRQGHRRVTVTTP